MFFIQGWKKNVFFLEKTQPAQVFWKKTYLKKEKARV